MICCPECDSYIKGNEPVTAIQESPHELLNPYDLYWVWVFSTDMKLMRDARERWIYRNPL